MKIVTQTTFIVDKGKTVAPGNVIDIDDSEAVNLIDRGLAQAYQPEADPAASSLDKNVTER